MAPSTATIMAGIVTEAKALRKTVFVTVPGMLPEARRAADERGLNLIAKRGRYIVHDKKRELDVNDMVLIKCSKPPHLAVHFSLLAILQKANTGFGGGGRADSLAKDGGVMPDKRTNREKQRQAAGLSKQWTGPGGPTLAWLMARAKEKEEKEAEEARRAEMGEEAWEAEKQRERDEIKRKEDEEKQALLDKKREQAERDRAAAAETGWPPAIHEPGWVDDDAAPANPVTPRWHGRFSEARARVEARTREEAKAKSKGEKEVEPTTPGQDEWRPVFPFEPFENPMRKSS